ncbi:tetratricopeptide repeat-containing protein [Silvimonas amylolytica]|uniref:Uncharacterized protein n=1 Tax=Silvimonas amylolytica TaxID=449663 RepID=A0ABQ2PMJ1_9NEIS|nr:tetratricopeptide repeat-containing protein [Silvimonas amylolytica]GGP26832.1 hypothetical protein GCM10010971_26510 [Silvimonas amylolytica]
MDCFVIRGFGEKKDSGGELIDFDMVDRELIKPAMEKCGLVGGTTAIVQGSGPIHQDMFQLILRAAVVICDITVHNPNVFYELGVRHALRKKYTVLIKGTPSNDRAPFDIAGLRYMEYSWADPGKDVEKLIDVINAAQALDRETDSPIFLMMPKLQQADSRSIGAVPPSFTQEVQLARSRKDKGWLRLLAEDVRGEIFEREGLRLVGREQWALKDFKVAARTWKEVLAGDKGDVEANHALANVYERLYKIHGDPADLERSNLAIQNLLAGQNLLSAQHAEALALRGRNLKTLWRLDFANLDTQEERRERAIDTRARDAYDAYREAYRVDLNHFFPGLAALQMGHILKSLSMSTRFKNLFAGIERRASRYLEDLEDNLAALTHIVKAATERGCAMLLGDDLIWARIAAADLLFLDRLDDAPGADYSVVVDAYRDAVPKGTFFWDAARGQLELFEQLGIGVPAAQAVFRAFDEPITVAVESRGTPTKKIERHLVIFSGHNVDRTGATLYTPRFPASEQGRARALIEAALKQLNDEADDCSVLVSAAPGADILALEACQSLGIKTWLCLPMSRDIVASEVFKDYDIDWRNRFFALADAQPLGRTFVLSDDAGLPQWLFKHSMTPWSRGNRWMLHQAQAWGANKVTLLALWDHNKGDMSPNGTAEMLRLAENAGGVYVRVIDSRSLTAN